MPVQPTERENVYEQRLPERNIELDQVKKPKKSPWGGRKKKEDVIESVVIENGDGRYICQCSIS